MEHIPEEIKKTPYEWCLDLNIRVVDVNTWPDKWFGSSERAYFEYEYGKEAFKAALTMVKEVKPNSMPRKTENYLEYRMYGLVPYNISSIQSGIQFGHAVVEYQQRYKDDERLNRLYNKWAENDKTFIILNGGTTNQDIHSKWYGTLQQYRDNLLQNGIPFAQFNEPDLNDTLTAIVFLVDERVFNRELYEDYTLTPQPWSYKGRNYEPKESELKKWEEENDKNYKNWVDKIGGPGNVFLRETLKNFKLAN